MNQSPSFSTVREFVKNWLTGKSLDISNLRETILIVDSELWGYRFHCEEIRIDWKFGSSEVSVVQNQVQSQIQLHSSERLAA